MAKEKAASQHRTNSICNIEMSKKKKMDERNGKREMEDLVIRWRANKIMKHWKEVRNGGPIIIAQGINAIRRRDY